MLAFTRQRSWDLEKPSRGKRCVTTHHPCRFVGVRRASGGNLLHPRPHAPSGTAQNASTLLG